MIPKTLAKIYPRSTNEEKNLEVRGKKIAPKKKKTDHQRKIKGRSLRNINFIIIKSKGREKERKKLQISYIGLVGNKLDETHEEKRS